MKLHDQGLILDPSIWLEALLLFTVNAMTKDRAVDKHKTLRYMPHYIYSEQLSGVMKSNNGSNVNDTSAGSSSETERNLKALLYCSLFLIGIIGNFLVIFVVKAKRRRSINDVFILNLAFSDLAFLTLSLPFYTYELFSSFTKTFFYCKIIWPMMSVVLSASVFTLVSMATERSRGILHPLKPRIQLRTTLIWIFVVWLCSVITILPLMIVANPEETKCTEDWPNDNYRKIYTAILFGIQYAVPSLVIAGVYVRIAVSLVRTKGPSRTSMNSRGELVQHKTRADNLQIIRTVATIIILFMACMLPNQIAWILFDFGGEDNRELSHEFWNFAEALMYLHSCINPIVYGTLTKQFRRGYVRYVRLIFCCSETRDRSDHLTENRSEKSKSAWSPNRNDVVRRRDPIMCTKFVLNSPRSAADSPDFSFRNVDESRVSVRQVSLKEAQSTEFLNLPHSNDFTSQEMGFVNLTFENVATKQGELDVQDTRL